MRTVVRDGLAFDVHEAGPADGPPVLLLHGFPQSGASWGGVASRLAARGFHTVAPDQRGYSPGARPPGRRAYTLTELTADALAVLDDVVGVGAPAHVVGHDWGASVAWRLAAVRPERVLTLTAVSVPPAAAYLRALVTTRQGLVSWYVYAAQLPLLPERVLGARGAPFSPVLAGMMRRTGQSRAAAERDARGLADPAALRGALNWYRAMFLDRPPRVGRVRVPTLFVWSDSDVALTRESTQTVHRHVTGPFRYVELRGVSHWIPDEAPDELAEVVLEHLGQGYRDPQHPGRHGPGGG